MKELFLVNLLLNSTPACKTLNEEKVHVYNDVLNEARFFNFHFPCYYINEAQGDFNTYSLIPISLSLMNLAGYLPPSLFYACFYVPQKVTLFSEIYFITDALFALLLETKRFSTARKPGSSVWLYWSRPQN